MVGWRKWKIRGISLKQFKWTEFGSPAVINLMLSTRGFASLLGSFAFSFLIDHVSYIL
jgi:hypothetical protein